MRESLRKLTSEDAMGFGRATPRPSFGKSRRVRVELLDGSYIDVDIDRKARGADLLDKVCESLDLIEKDYFGLLYEERGDARAWLDLGKRLSKIFKNKAWDAKLAVKFYPPEPSELLEDFTRYQLTLAVRQDLIEGRLTCSAITYALLASYVLQAELGDREAAADAGSALRERRVAPPGLHDDLEEKILELYRNHKGQTPAESELNFLENAKKLSLYGTELHSARDSDDVDIAIGVCAGGITVYRDGILMNRFPWAKILKIGYSERAYSLRLRAGAGDAAHTRLDFRLPAARAAKKLWRTSVEQHMFFRRAEPVRVRRACAPPRRLSCRRTLRQLRAAADADADPVTRAVKRLQISL